MSKLGPITDTESDPFEIQKCRESVRHQYCGVIYVTSEEFYECENQHSTNMPFARDCPLGIVNFSNSCYVSATYHILNNINNFEDCVIAVHNRLNCENHSVINVLGDLFVASRGRNSINMLQCSKKLKQLVELENSDYVGNKHQDCSDFLIIILDILDQELQKAIISQKLSDNFLRNLIGLRLVNDNSECMECKKKGFFYSASYSSKLLIHGKARQVWGH